MTTRSVAASCEARLGVRLAPARVTAGGHAMIADGRVRAIAACAAAPRATVLHAACVD